MKRVKSILNREVLAACIGICTFLFVTGSDGRAVAVTGTVTQTNVRHFEFFARIANPCEIGPGNGRSARVPISASTTETTPAPVLDEVKMDFYQSVATQVEITLRKLQVLEANDPSIIDCNGLSLNSLPGTPLMDEFTEAQTLKQTYKTGIFLTTHFHLMSLDRQTTIRGDNNVPDDQIQDDIPSWRFLRCGNESESFPVSLQEVTASMENVLCTMLSSATDEQRASFRDPFNKLGKTVLYRYHTSCSTLQTRDCLVVREAKQALALILRKFTKLIMAVSSSDTDELNSGRASVMAQDDGDMMENSL